MGKRKHKFKVHSFEELLDKYPLAAETKTIYSANYSYIAKLLDCQLEVPGIEILDSQTQLDLVSKAEVA